MPARHPFSWSPVLRSAFKIRCLLAGLILSLTVGCADGEPKPLEGDERVLLQELVDLHRQRLLRAKGENPPPPALQLDETQRNLVLDRLGNQPDRAELLLRALQDSLRLMRAELISGKAAD